MHQFNGASTRYQSNFGEVHLYKGLHLCDTSQLTKAFGATKPTQRFAQSTFASSQLCSSEKKHPKILPSTPAICLYTLWTFTMMFFRANLTQSTLYNARTINLKRPTNWGRHPIHSKFPICPGLHDFRSISITISNVFLIFLSSWYFLSYMYHWFKILRWVNIITKDDKAVRYIVLSVIWLVISHTIQTINIFLGWITLICISLGVRVDILIGWN